MRKITLVLVAFFATMVVIAQPQLKNPRVSMPELGEGATAPVVLWDCATNNFAASNAMEIDETITLAFDISETNLLTWIQSAPAGVTRGIGLDVWLDGTGTDADGKHIFMGRVDYRPIADGSHIYAVDVNFAQTAARAGNGPAIPLVQVAGMQTWIRATLLGYGFEQGNADLEWWEQSAGNHIYDEMVILTAPYTGTKTGEEFYNDDFDQVLSIGGGYEDIQGVAIHCLAPKAASGINEFSVQQDVTAREYYNLQGMKLNKTPENGLYIEKSILTNGSSVSSKIFNVVK